MIGMQSRWIAITLAFLVMTSLDVRVTWAAEALTVIVPLGKGGALDRFARTAERFLPNVMDVEVSVENVAPKTGRDGYRRFLESPADGTTILAWMEPAAAAYAPGVSLDDLTIINVQEIEPPILAARADLGWNGLDDMIQSLRLHPNAYSFGTGSRTGGGAILTTALLDRLGLEVTQATYLSGGKARRALLRGEVDMTAGSLSAIRKLGERVKPLAVFAPRRLRSWPEVPTIGEALGTDEDLAILGAVYRFYAVHTAFAERQPEAFASLVDGFRRMVEEDEAFRADAEARGVGALWLGPVESNALIRRSHQHFVELLEQQRQLETDPKHLSDVD